MNSKLTPFQAVIFAILIIAIIAGVIIFSVRRTSDNQKPDLVRMWGTLPFEFVEDLQVSINGLQENTLNIEYQEFSNSEFESSLIEALAAGEGPDIAILTDDLLVRHENKLFTVDYEFYPQIDFKNNFIEGSEVLLKNEGLIGLPFMVDPLVLYWNRSILNGEGIASPPEYWDEFLTKVPTIVRVDSASNISRAGIALGEFRNIKNAKNIFISLVQQAGNDIVVRDLESEEFISTFSQRLGFKNKPANAAVDFFTQFSNPTKSVYSWNRSLPESDEMFTAGDLAFYLGFASERGDLIKANPNLNFEVALVPQSRSSDAKSVYGKLSYLAVMNSSQNISAAFSAIVNLTSKPGIENLNKITDLPPVRRDLLSVEPTAVYKEIFNRSALIAEPFLDPNKVETSQIFQDMIESVISGRSGTSDAVNRADLEIQSLFR